MTTTLADFAESTFEHDGKARTVYRRGSGPAVIVMSELPGITPKVMEFAQRVVDAGFTVFMPHLFGIPGAEASPVVLVRATAPACVSKEFAAFAAHSTAPVSTWLRALSAFAHDECGGPGVGALGMCFTGGFALGMMVDERMIAPVLSQPSLPITPPWRRGNASEVGLSDADL